MKHIIKSNLKLMWVEVIVFGFKWYYVLVWASKALLLDDYNDDDDINAGQPFAKPSSGSEFLGFGVFLCFFFFLFWAIADQYIVQNLYYPN